MFFVMFRHLKFGEMKIRFILRKAVTVVSAAAFCLASSPAVKAGLPPISLAQMYSYASSGNVRALRAAVQRGLNIDSVDRFGNTGLCHAILQNNCTAYNAFRSAGANPRSPCIQNIPTRQYDNFMDQSCAAAITDTPRQAYNKFNEGEFIIAKRTWIIGGILLAGGLVAILAGGGGGGGGSHYYFVPYTEPDDSLAKFAGTKSPNTPESSPYKAIKYFADNNQTIVNKVEGSETNDFSISNNSSIKVKNDEGTEEDKKLVDIIDLNGNILDYAAYLQVGMKARNNSSVINGTAEDGANAPMITLGDATVGMAADDKSSALNYGTIKVLAQNGTLGMAAGNHSTATNQNGNINLQFKGFNDTDSIIGMYADTYSSIINNGSITGNTIDVSGTTGAGSGSSSGSGTGDTGDAGDTTEATANAGTIIGMEVRTVNEVSYPDRVDPSTASNNGSITLNAQSDSAAIRTSLIGMGGYLDKDFLDGTKLIRRASSLYLFNGVNGEIELNYTLTGSGTYAPDANTLLKGNGGIIGMRADAKTSAINKGKISMNLSSGVDNAGAGMQAVHGGSISNENEISVIGGKGNSGMLSVRGQGSNAEIDSLLPTLTNTSTGKIVVNSEDGFGMASFNGGTVTNNGSITMKSKSTGMRTNNGILTNGTNATITLENNGSGMVLKSGDPTTDTAASDGDGSGDGDDDAAGGDTTDDSSDTSSATKQDLSRAQAVNNGTITINNADDAKGIFIEDGTAINNGSGIIITNTSRVPSAASYGIKAEKGTVENNSKIDMNVLVSTDGSTSVDSYGIFSDSANITNGVNGSVVFRKRGTGIATTSGRVINMGSIKLEQGGTGISSANGDVYNAENAQIVIDDNNTASSTGIVAQAGKITNDGTISITNGNGATGIKAGLLVNNNKLITLTGRNITGIELTGQDAIANNYDDISITSNGISENNFGIKAGASAVNATITNNNDIKLTGSSSYSSTQQKGYGISIVDGTAENKGSITFDGMYGWGMYTTTGTVKNSTGSIIMNAGGTGLYGNGSGAQMINSQKIAINVPDNDDKAETYGIYADGGASASNTANAEIYIKSSSVTANMLAKAFGIYVNQGSGTNQGTIKIEGSNTVGMAYAGSTDTDAIINLESGLINLTGNNHIGMTAAGGVATNRGTINVGVKTDDGTITASPYSVGMQTTGGIVLNQGTVNVNSANSVGLQSDDANGVITNNGTIYIDDTALNSYAFLSKAGSAVNGTTGIVINNQSNTDYMRAEGGEIRNNGTLTINNSVSNVNAMHVAEGGSALNYGDEQSGVYGTINVGTSSSATGTNNVGMLVDGDEAGSATNEGVINVYSKDSYGMKVDNENGSLINNGTINIMAGATGSVAMYGEKGTISNGKKGVINMGVSGTVMKAADATISNEGTITLANTASTAMRITNNGTAQNAASGTINVNSSNSYALAADDGATATLNNAGTININNGATGSYAMYGKNATLTNETSGTINVLQSGTTAMFTQVGKLTNKGKINLAAADAIGLYVTEGQAVNDSGATIDVNSNGKAMNVVGTGSITNSGTINLNAANAYGLYAQNGGTATNSGTIKLNSSGTAYGMYGSGGAKLTNNSSINGKAENAYGMYGSNMTNAGTISITGTGTGASYGMRSTGGTVSNTGQIEVTASQAYGISLTGSGTATNSGTITVTGTGSDTSYGMYGSGGAKLINNGTINVNSTSGTAVGMYATGSGSSITNTGNIVLNGVSITTDYSGISSSDDPDTDATNCTSAGCGNFIKVENGATFRNNGQVSSASAINFNVMSAANTGTIMLARGGSFEAPEISGEITAAADIVTEGNETTYVNENSFVGQDSGIKLNSGSYLFDAYLVTNEAGNQDVVMTMKNFADVVDNGSVANFLSSNYTLGTNMDMYSILKAAGDATSFTTAVAEQMGLNLIPSFAKQNMDIVKAVNRHMSQTLFANQSSNDVRAMFDFVYDYREQDGVNMLSGYEDNAATAYALFDRKYNNNFRYGLGVSFTRYESDYDNGSSRDEVVAQVLAPLIYTTEGLKAVSMPRLGIGWGEYKRRIGSDESKADVKNYYYGITNEVRKEIDLGTVTLEPTAEFNILGLYQDSTKEKNGLEVKSANNLSVEGGIGLYARKSFSIMEENDLTLRAGGSWYHEFNNPYQAARARIAGMLGSYQMDTYDVERDRGILSVRMDYKHDRFDFYFEANKFLEEDDGYALSAGLGYKF
ncbi:outer membrane autotransporter barrel domain protein [Azospirillum sp. CAG:239]|nr:outer membrane autotransporter barrel domain protein [Azospirillum sp. CAG:239]